MDFDTIKQDPKETFYFDFTTRWREIMLKWLSNQVKNKNKRLNESFAKLS